MKKTGSIIHGSLQAMQHTGKQKTVWLLAALLIVTALAYAPLAGNGFTNWDDPDQLINNSDVHQLSWANSSRIFSSFYVGMYQPLTMHAYAVLYAVAGPDPRVFHLFSLLLHLVNVVLVFSLVRAFTRKDPTALVSAALFALSPLQSESLAWISALSNLMYTGFFLGGLMAYLAYVRSSRWHLLAWTFLFFLLSLLSKPSAVTFPLIILGIDMYFRRTIKTRLLLEKLPFFLLALVSGLVIVAARREAGHIIDLSGSYAWWEQALLVSYSLSHYLANLIAPVNLSAFHPYPSTPLPAAYFIAPIIPLMFIFLYLRLRAEVRRQYTVGMLFFLLNIMLFLEIIQLGVQIVKERYAYLPSVGLYYAVSTLLFFFFPGGKYKISRPLVLIVLAVLWYGMSTFSRAGTWKDSITLWTDVLNSYPQASAAYINRGNAYMIRADYKLAIDDYTRAVEYEPYAADAYLNRAIVYSKMEEYNHALDDYNRAVGMGIHDAVTYNSRALLKARLKDIKGAKGDFLNALEMDPDYADAWINLGLMYANNSEFNKAMDALINAVRSDSRSARAYYWRGMVQLNMKQYEGACRDLKIARDYGWPVGQLPEICN